MKWESASGIQTPIDCRDSNIAKVVINAKTGNVIITLPMFLPTADNPRSRPTIKPDSFVVLEVGEEKRVIEKN